MDKIARIRQEIERLMDEYTDIAIDSHYGTVNANHVVADLEQLVSFLDTFSEDPDNDASLEASASYDTQKYTPRPSVDIEDVARVQFASHAKVFDKKRKAVFDWEQFKEVAGIFYGFGKKNSLPEESSCLKESDDLEKAAEEYACSWREEGNKGVRELFPKPAYRAFIAGAEWQKQQMLKEAVEGEIQMRYSGCLCAKTIRAINEDKFKFGDKVRIVVLKEEE